MALSSCMGLVRVLLIRLAIPRIAFVVRRAATMWPTVGRAGIGESRIGVHLP
jgi:hypothetical protein